MQKQGMVKSITEVAASNISTLLAGVLVAFLLPKMISVDDYGHYKTFTLYCTYIGLFSLEIIDGIALKYGGYAYDSLDRKRFRSYFKWYTAIHLIFAVLIFSISIFLVEGEARFIWCSIGVFLILNNITGYFQQISQITQRYREYSARKIIQSVLNVCILIALYFLYKKGVAFGYRAYLISWIIINGALTLWYVNTYRVIIFGESYTFADTKSDIKKLMREGVPLLVSNLCATLILTLDRQFVNILFTNAEYAIYAFAYNMLSLVTVATSAVSTVLYPTMKRGNYEKLKNNYSYLISMVLFFVCACESLYFPLSIFVKWFLPKYVDSLVIFRVIFPGLSISTAITVIMHNYYKVLGENIRYFRRSLLVLFISAIANLIAYYFWRTTISISIASIITMIAWYLMIESYFYKEFKYDGIKNFLYLVLCLVLFYTVSWLSNDALALVIYVQTFLLLTYLLFRKTFSVGKIKELINH